MRHVDAISRNPPQKMLMCRAITMVTETWKKIVQDEDMEIQEIIRNLKNGEQNCLKEYTIENGSLHKKNRERKQMGCTKNVSLANTSLDAYRNLKELDLSRSLMTIEW